MQNLVREPLHLADARRVWLRPLSFEDDPQMLDLLRTSGHPVQVRCDGGDVLSVELDGGQPAAIAGTRGYRPRGAGCSAQSEGSSDPTAPDHLPSHDPATARG